MKISSVIALLAAVSPCVSAIRGQKKSVARKMRRQLKGDKGGGGDGGDDIFGGLPDGAGDIIDAFGCFSEMATVQVQGASEPVSMTDLSVGDFVLSNDGSYQQVYAWGHKSVDQQATFFQLYSASSEEPLELTGEHLVYVTGKANPVRADSVQTGDVLESTGSNAEIRKIRQIKRTGVYTPLTTTGKIVVNNIYASSYVSLQENASEFVQVKGVNTPLTQHYGIHLCLSPFRMMCKLVECNTQNENGIPSFIDNGIQFSQWVETQNGLVQLFLFSVLFLLAGFCMVLENSVGLPLVVSAAYAAMKFNAARSSKAKTV